MRLYEVINKSYVGTCISSFDDDLCNTDLLPYNDATEFAIAEENATEITKQEFLNNVNISDHKPEINSETIFLHDKQNDVYMLYEPDKDIHHFFN